MLQITGDAADILRDLGLDPASDDALPHDEQAIREMIDEHTAECVDLTTQGNAALTHPFGGGCDPDDAWRFEDGSSLLRTGATWMATDANGVDPHGVRWVARVDGADDGDEAEAGDEE